MTLRHLKEMVKKFYIKEIVVITLLILGVVFSTQVRAASTLYFDGSTDNDWSTIENWWTDPGFSIAAGTIPADGDTAYIEADVITGPSSGVALADLFVGQNATVSLHAGSGITVTGTATFGSPSSSGSLFFGTISGEAIFNNESTVLVDGTINGDAIFNDESCNMGQVSDNAIFTYAGEGTLTTSCGWGTVGTAKGIDDVVITHIILTGGAVNYADTETMISFYDGSQNQATISGNPIFYDSSNNNSGTIEGNPTFYDESFNLAVIIGTASFLDSSNNLADVTGDACFAATAANNGSVSNMVFDNCPEIMTTTLPSGTDGVLYTISILADNILGVVSYELTSGELPDGLELSGNELTGTPTEEGDFTFTIRAVDDIDTGNFYSTEEEFTITIEAAPDEEPEDAGGGGHSGGGGSGGDDDKEEVVPPTESPAPPPEPVTPPASTSHSTKSTPPPPQEEKKIAMTQEEYYKMPQRLWTIGGVLGENLKTDLDKPQDPCKINPCVKVLPRRLADDVAWILMVSVLLLVLLVLFFPWLWTLLFLLFGAKKEEKKNTKLKPKKLL